MSTERLKLRTNREKLLGAGVGLALAASALAGCKAETAGASAPEASGTPAVEQTTGTNVEQGGEQLASGMVEFKADMDTETLGATIVSNLEAYLSIGMKQEVADEWASADVVLGPEEFSQNYMADQRSNFAALFANPEDPTAKATIDEFTQSGANEMSLYLGSLYSRQGGDVYESSVKILSTDELDPAGADRKIRIVENYTTNAGDTLVTDLSNSDADIQIDVTFVDNNGTLLISDIDSEILRK